MYPRFSNIIDAQILDSFKIVGNSNKQKKLAYREKPKKKSVQNKGDEEGSDYEPSESEGGESGDGNGSENEGENESDDSFKKQKSSNRFLVKSNESKSGKGKQTNAGKVSNVLMV